jgi:hypothetical protein
MDSSTYVVPAVILLFIVCGKIVVDTRRLSVQPHRTRKYAVSQRDLPWSDDLLIETVHRVNAYA